MIIFDDWAIRMLLFVLLLWVGVGLAAYGFCWLWEHLTRPRNDHLPNYLMRCAS